MARYTGSFTLAVTNNPNLRQAMIEVLKTCGLELVYDRREYIMAREIPGKVALSKLVAIEVLIDTVRSTQAEMRMNLVVKNEELPLQLDNHCHQIFERVNQAIADNQKWQLVESIAS
jgi:hypothetical protein